MISLLAALALMPQLESGGCRAAAVPIEAGAVIDAENTVRAPCPAKAAETKSRYDRHAAVVRARVPIAAGEALGRVALLRRPRVLAGETVNVVARFGAVTVSRGAIALQSAQVGSAFFARGEDGQIFAAPAITEEAR